MPVIARAFTSVTTFGGPRPMLPVLIENPVDPARFYVYAHGLIDTGSSYSAIPAEFAVPLGHGLKHVKPVSIRGAGSRATGYGHTVNLRVLDVLPNGRTDYVRTVIETGPARFHFISGLPCVLLGVSDFLRGFVLTVDYPRHRFTLATPPGADGL